MFASIHLIYSLAAKAEEAKMKIKNYYIPSLDAIFHFEY